MSKELLRNTLLKLPQAKPVSSGREIGLRCPFCGDSKKDPTHVHFYVNINKDPFVFDCKRCEKGGLLTPGVLRKLNVFDPEILRLVKQQLPDRIVKTIGNRDEFGDLMYLIPEVNPKNFVNKVDYLSKRTGVDFYDQDNLQRYRIILSVESFYEENKIPIPPTAKQSIIGFEKSAVGFLSYDRKSIQFRNVLASKSRYINFSVDDRRRAFLYVPQREIDVLAQNPKIVINEGPIGNIVVANKYYTDDMSDVVFGAAGSFGLLKQAFLRLVELTGYVGGELIIYSDPEISFQKYSRGSFKQFKGIFPTKIMYNKSNGGSDFNDINNGFSIKTYQL